MGVNSSQWEVVRQSHFSGLWGRLSGGRTFLRREDATLMMEVASSHIRLL